ncbi:MAG: carbamoyltransferase HypF [Thermoprotei archaeon]|nr:MAG: carbamoyltransferase HypF [Thermoprotei archaeon]
MLLVRATIHVVGLVQGVGFRPFVYRLATSLNLKGYVLNLGDAGVEIIVEGSRDAVERFLELLRVEKPAPAVIESVSVEFSPYTGEFSDFRIVSSDFRVKGVGSTIPPDLAICDDCVRDIMGDNPRWSKYPFTCCAVCGPRFTMIYDLPYDRERTSMSKFPMCSDCLREYNDPADRRYHAEGICCSRCGPTVELLRSDGSLVSCSDPIEEAARLVKEGFIVAVKGIGGFHIACLATDGDVILKLRRRRRRPQQPFAVMSPSLQDVESFAYISKLEAELLTSKERPIVVLKVKSWDIISRQVSPGLDSIGVMLPYTGLHLLLLKYVGEPALIMTSGNYPGEPMVTSVHEALRRLSGIADFFLNHNRDIVNRCDDSVVRVSAGVPTFLRRSRGYAPSPIRVAGIPDGNWVIAALGGDLNVTGAVLRGDKCYVTQHIGDVDNLETLEFLKSALRTITRLMKVKGIDLVVCDLNRSFPTTKWAQELGEELGVEVVYAQHHHAHAASLAAEQGLGLDDYAVYIAIDGVGLGTDGSAWGGEILVASCGEFRRIGCLRPYPLPGGDLCAYYPVRAMAGILSLALSESELESLLLERYSNFFRYGGREVQVVLKQLRSGFNVVNSSSLGRFLDSVSVMLKVCGYRSYEGEPAMKLEAHANMDPRLIEGVEPHITSRGNLMTLETGDLLLQLLELLDKHPTPRIAYTAHVAVARGLAEMACRAAEEEGIRVVGVTGGAAVNEIIVSVVEHEVSRRGLKFLRHRALPPGDGGLSAGQALIGLAHR